MELFDFDYRLYEKVLKAETRVHELAALQSSSVAGREVNQSSQSFSLLFLFIQPTTL